MPDSLFGGGTDQNGAPTDVPINAIRPPYLNGMSDTVQTNEPGQLSRLALDLQGGGFTSGPAGKTNMANWLSSIFRPAQTYGPVKAKPKTPVIPKTPPVAPGAPSSIPPRYLAMLNGRNAR